MDQYNAEIMFNSHIRKVLLPLTSSGTMLVLFSKNSVIHIYTDRDNDVSAPNDTMKIFVLEKERQGNNVDSMVSIKKYDAIDIAKIISSSNHIISMLNSNEKIIENMIDYDLLNHRNTIDPNSDTPLKKIGPAHHNFCSYTHNMVSGMKPIECKI